MPHTTPKDVPTALPRRSRRQRRAPPGSPPGVLVADPAAPKPRISVIAYGPGRLEERHDVEPEALHDLRTAAPVLWINVDGLGDVDVLQSIGTEFDLHQLALEDVVNVHQRPKVEEYGDHLFIVCRMPHTGRRLDTEQVTLFLGRDFIITFQERPGDCFEAIRNRLRTQRGRIRSDGADYLAYALLDAVTDAYFPVLEKIGDQLDELEGTIMAEPGEHDIRLLHRLKQDLLTVRRAAWPQREMLGSIIRDDNPLISDRTKIFMRDCFDHSFQLMDLIETYREVVSDMTDLYLSAQSARMNEVMKVLTVIATIFMPLTLVTGIYGMNFDTKASPWNMPELEWAFGYPGVLLVMAVIAGGMLVYFWRRGWIGTRSRPRHPSSRRPK